LKSPDAGETAAVFTPAGGYAAERLILADVL
jgi:hypothetical protein